MLERARNVHKNENPEENLTGRAERDYILDKLSPVDSRVLSEIITPVVERTFAKEECLGGILVVGSVANKKKSKYNDVDLFVILDDPERDSERVANRLERELKDCNQLMACVFKDFVPSPTGGELVTNFFIHEPRVLMGINLPLVNSSVFEMRICPSFNYPYDDYLNWLAENNFSYCLWLEKTG